MQRIQPKPQPKPAPELQAGNRSNPHRNDYNPSSIRRPIPKHVSTAIGKPKTKPIAILVHGHYEDGTRCSWFVDERGREVNRFGELIVYDDDDESSASFLPVERRQTKKTQAAELLRKWLQNGPVSVAAIKKRALAAGISWSTIDKARYELGLVAIKGTGRGAGWFWILPK